MAHILTHTCTAHPHGVNDDYNSGDLEPLVKWDESQWDESGLLGSFRLLRSLVIRQDAKINYTDKSDIENNAGDLNSEIANAPWFEKKFKLMEEQISIHTILSPIRNALEMQVRRTGKDSIGKKKLDKVCHDVGNLPEDSHVKEALLTLFETHDDDNGDKPRLVLKGLSELNDLLNGPPFDLVHFQSAVENLIHRINQYLTNGRDCALIQARYTIPKESALYRTLQPRLDVRVATFSAHHRKNAISLERAKLNELRRGREALKSGHGDDPLDAAVEASHGAKPSDEQEDGEQPKGSGKKKSKRAPRLTIVEDMDEDEDEDVKEAAAKLSEVPRRKRKSAAAENSLQPIPPDEGIFDENGKVLKRLRWTEEEKMCVREGVKLYGVGRWKEIKSDYEAILRNRTPVQIKDCWRTMTKNDEV